MKSVESEVLKLHCQSITKSFSFKRDRKCILNYILIGIGKKAKIKFLETTYFLNKNVYSYFYITSIFEKKKT